LFTKFDVHPILQEDIFEVVNVTLSITHNIQGILILGRVSAVVVKPKYYPTALNSILKYWFLSGIRTFQGIGDDC
jgi:hypothetical protein